MKTFNQLSNRKAVTLNHRPLNLLEVVAINQRINSVVDGEIAKGNQVVVTTSKASKPDNIKVTVSSNLKNLGCKIFLDQFYVDSRLGLATGKQSEMQL